MASFLRAEDRQSLNPWSKELIPLRYQSFEEVRIGDFYFKPHLIELPPRRKKMIRPSEGEEEGSFFKKRPLFN